MAEVSRAQYLLNIIEQMDIENTPEYSLNHAQTGYRYMNRGEGNLEPQYPTGKRPSGLGSPAGKSS